MALQEDIAKLVGRLRFEADNRPLIAFSKNIQKVQKDLEALTKVANKKLTLKVGVNAANLKTEIKNAVAGTNIQLDKVGISGKALQEIRDRIQRVVTKNKINLTLGVNSAKLSSQIRSQLRAIMQSIGTINIPSPTVKLKVDRTHLRQEIQQILQQIEREARIRLNLRTDFGPRPGPAPSPANPRPAPRGAAGSGLGAASAHWSRGFVPGLGGAFAVSQLNKINQEMQGQTNAYTAIMGGESQGAEQQKWVKDLSNQIGMDYRKVAPAYGKMLASGQTSGMSTESVQNIFKGVSEYGRVMGLDSESMKGSMKAIEQMMNKGQVMSEELKGQLAERMPGAMSAMADAAGFGTDEKGVAKLMDAMKKGEVKSTAVLEKFATILAERSRQGGALEKAMQSTAAQQARFNNSFSDAVKVFSEGGFDKAMGSFFKEAAAAITKAEPMIRGLGAAFDYVMIPVRMLVRMVGDLGAHIGELATFFGTTADKLTLFSAGALLAMTPLGRMLEIVTGITLALEDFVTYLEDGESIFGEWMASLSPEKADAIKTMGYEIKELGNSFKTLATLTWQGWEGLFGFFTPDGGSGLAIDGITKLAAGINDLAAALKALRSGDNSEANEVLANLAGGKEKGKGLYNLLSGNQTPSEYFENLVTPRSSAERDPRSLATKREAEQREARKKAYETMPPSPMAPNQPAQDPQAGRDGSPMNSQSNPTQLVVHGNLVLDMPGVTGDPTSIEKAVNQVLHKAVRSINSNQTEGEQ